MKRNLFRLYIVVFFFLSDFMAFAQPTEDEDGDLQGDDEPTVSINKKLIWLGIAGILYAFYRFKGSGNANAEKPV